MTRMHLNVLQSRTVNFSAATLFWLALSLSSAAGPAALDPIVYTLRAPAPETNIAVIEARIPTDRRASVDLMLPVWSPGFYGLGDYARNVHEFAARTPEGTALTVDKPKSNHWVVATNGAPAIVISYKLLCRSTFVTGSWVGPGFAVINGPSTFITLTEKAERPHEVHLELPPAWKQSITSLDHAPDGRPNHYRGPNYDVFIDSPIVAGTISTHEFEVGGSKHVLADFGDLGAWNGEAAAGKIKLFVDEHRRFLGGTLPFKRYVFLNAFRGGQGGLEHLNSSLLSSPRGPTTSEATLRWLKYVSHEYFHAINVKRLRPVELGPFDYEQLPQTPSLWISEGLTTYYGDLAVVRSGVGSAEDFLAGVSGRIRTLQTSPGRLLQTLEQASLSSGVSSSSGVGGNRNATISYYDKGPIVGLLLDARIRRATNDRRSLDDGMRLAIRRYSGARGFTPEEFQQTMREVAGVDLSAFFKTTLVSTDELDYREMLDWFGLKFAEPESADAARAWRLEVNPAATPDQQRHFAKLLAPSAGK
jgi:predicted metalloprotease with PDZ domain